MWRVLAFACMVGLLAVGTSTRAMAGGALAARLLPTGNAIVCGFDPQCESNGSGSAATLKIKGVNNMSFIMEGLLSDQTYHASVGSEGCGNIVATFNSTADGTVNIVQPLTSQPNLGDIVEICRQNEGSWKVIYNGTLSRLNGQ